MTLNDPVQAGMQQQTALARHYSEAQKLSPFDPQNLQQAMQVADMLSKSSLVPTAFRGKPADILLVIMGGRELGFSTVQSLRGFFVINGKLGMHADAMVAVCVGKPQCKYFRLIESTPLVATYETQREGSEPVRLSFTMEQAKKAGYSSNQNYSKNPDAMLRARCASALGRIVYPDYLAGVYDPSELEDSVTAPEAARTAKPLSVDQAPAAVAEAFEGIPGSSPGRDAGSRDGGSVSHSVEASTSQHFNPFATDPEFNDESPEQKKHVKGLDLQHYKFPSGSMKGQYIEAAPVSYLLQVRDHLRKSIEALKELKSPPKMKDLKFEEALTFWIDRKEAEGDADFTEAEITTNQEAVKND